MARARHSENEIHRLTEELELSTLLNKGVLQSNSEYKIRIAELERENKALGLAESLLSDNEDKLHATKQRLADARAQLARKDDELKRAKEDWDDDLRAEVMKRGEAERDRSEWKGRCEVVEGECERLRGAWKAMTGAWGQMTGGWGRLDGGLRGVEEAVEGDAKVTSVKKRRGRQTKADLPPSPRKTGRVESRIASTSPLPTVGSSKRRRVLSSDPESDSDSPHEINARPTTPASRRLNTSRSDPIVPPPPAPPRSAPNTAPQPARAKAARRSIGSRPPEAPRHITPEPKGRKQATPEFSIKIEQYSPSLRSSVLDDEDDPLAMS